ncbi:ATPase, F1/V1/A1 complex, alpha/beta subunit [Tanacetum coccineum]|uniref:ATPase, F1/V1/A1 complex, alpha/beta subunit n=1 Tax=Tanacetum coccineum TaxID=301880 RepID=A0ABQ5GV69_9ASTR
MSTYLRNMAGYKNTQLKNKSFEEIQMLFDKEMKRVNSFVPMDSEVVEGSGKKIERSIKNKLQLCLEIVPRDDEAVNIIRADGSEKYYKIFSAMLDDFDRQDVLDLYRLGSTPAGNTPGGMSYAIGLSMESDDTMNEDTLVPESFPPLTTPVTTTAGDAPAYGFFLGNKVAYPVVANYVRNTWGKYGLVRSMFRSSTRLFSFQFSSIDGLDAMLENAPWFIQNNPLILKKWHPDESLLKEDASIVPVWVKLYGVHVIAFSEDGLSAIATKMELKDNIVVAMPKITREGHYTCNVYVKYEWKLTRCSSCKVFGHIHGECLKNRGAGEKKIVKKPSQTSRGVLNSVELTIEVSNSNLFDVLNSVDNDAEFGTNGGTTNLVNNRATSSGSSFMNIYNLGEFASNTPIGEKINKIERQICEGKLRLLDNDENSLVPMSIVESNSKVEVVFDEMTNLRISTSGKDRSDKGYGNNSLLEQ